MTTLRNFTHQKDSREKMKIEAITCEKDQNKVIF